MIAAWMVYTIAVGFLLYAAALGAEYVTRALRVPARFVWLLAMMTTVVLAGRALSSSEGPAHPAPLLSNDRRSTRLETSIAEPSASVGSVSRRPTAEGRASVGPTTVERSLARFSSIGRAVGGAVSRIDVRALDRWNRALIVAWIASSALTVCWLLMSFLRLRRLAGELTAETIANRVLLVSEDVGPALLGILRTRIVLPRWVRELPPAEQEIIVAHERQHAVAFDPALVCASMCIVALQPWNMVLWMLLARLRLAVEADCDRRVLGEGGDVRAYGQLLVAMYERTSGLSPHVAFAERASNLERRIRRITSRPRLYSAAVGGSAIAATVFATAAWKTAAPQRTAPLSPPAGAAAVMRVLVPGATAAPTRPTPRTPAETVPNRFAAETVHEEPQIAFHSTSLASEPRAVTFRQIVVAATDLADIGRAERLADSLADLLRHGAPFAPLAKKYHDYAGGEVTDLPAPWPLDRLSLPYQKALGAAEIGDIVSFQVPGSSQRSEVPKFVVAQLIAIQRLGVRQASEPRPAFAHPDFSGTWVLDVTKSEANVLPRSATLRVTQTERSMTVEGSYTVNDSTGLTMTENFMLDGSPSTNTLPSALGRTTIDYTTYTTTAAWSEDVLVMTTTWQQAFPPYSQKPFTKTDRYSLSDDKKSLTHAGEMMVDGAPLSMKLVFVKQSLPEPWTAIPNEQGGSAATGPCATPDSIAIRGFSRLRDADVRSALRITPKTPISGPVVTQALKNLYATNNFEPNATTTCEIIGGKSVLVFNVTEAGSKVPRTSPPVASEPVTPIAPPGPTGPPPRYPTQLRAARTEGHVILEFTVDARGVPDTSSIKVVEETNPLFTDAIRQVLPMWRFQPAGVVHLPVRFMTVETEEKERTGQAVPEYARDPRTIIVVAAR